MGRHGRVKGFQTFVRHRGYLGYLSQARDVRAFLNAITVWFGELDQENSYFHDHAHQQIHYIHFTYKTSSNIMFYMMFI